MTSSINERVTKIVSVCLNVKPETITPQSHFIDDLGADSLVLVDLLMALEDEFNIEVPDEDAEQCLTVGDTVKYIGTATA
ncbi:acyl carrier protein [Mesorhizobium sp. SB112]|uniref:acyl carrier protein n=1 Tax=Mesorhizobium sp. SB112 TaxID=3151853 RepID=UPI0032655994